MTTLYQIHANINNLKAMVKELATFWQSGDSILLLGETAAFLDWLRIYIEEINFDDEFDRNIEQIQTIYILAKDIDSLNKNAKTTLNFSDTTCITDEQWIKLTLDFDRVVTLNSVS